MINAHAPFRYHTMTDDQLTETGALLSRICATPSPYPLTDDERRAAATLRQQKLIYLSVGTEGMAVTATATGHEVLDMTMKWLEGPVGRDRAPRLATMIDWVSVPGRPEPLEGTWNIGPVARWYGETRIAVNSDQDPVVRAIVHNFLALYRREKVIGVFEESFARDGDSEYTETVTTAESADGTSELRLDPSRLLDRTVTLIGIEKITARVCRGLKPGPGAVVVIDIRQCTGIPEPLMTMFVISLAKKFGRMHDHDLLVEVGINRPAGIALGIRLHDAGFSFHHHAGDLFKIARL